MNYLQKRSYVSEKTESKQVNIEQNIGIINYRYTRKSNQIFKLRVIKMEAIKNLEIVTSVKRRYCDDIKLYIFTNENEVDIFKQESSDLA